MSHADARNAPGRHAGWRVQVLQSHDVDEHAACLRGWQQRYDQLSAGAFAGRLEELSAGPVQAFRERTSQALRQRCEVWPDAVWCGITAGHDGSRINGRLVGDHGVMVCGSEGHFELISPAVHDILGVVADRETLQAHALTLGAAIAWPLVEGQPWLQATPAKRRLAQCRLRAVLALAEGAGEAHGRAGGALPSLQRALLDTMVDLLECPAEPAQERSNATVRRRLVQQVHEWIDADPAAVPSVPQLCERLHVSRRTLQYAFEAETAMSPVAYLRSVRLNGARRALRVGAATGITVQDAAALWGFWNLSQFACDYRSQFGERPSDTLRAGGAVSRRATGGRIP